MRSFVGIQFTVATIVEVLQNVTLIFHGQAAFSNLLPGWAGQGGNDCAELPVEVGIVRFDICS
jgi:hypothetical protein